MKKKIAILGSTGSIGDCTFNIINKDKKNFEIILLSTDKNLKKIQEQAKIFKVKNLLINDYKKYIYLKNKLKNKNIKIFNKVEDFKKKYKSKIDYTMIAISGLSGLNPTLSLIELSKSIAIANKESIICGWNLIQKKLKKFNTNFIPVDSEHFSIWSLIKDMDINVIEQIIITASGGPFLNLPIKKFDKITINKAINHPNWKMGKKISIDSATMMNKVFEVIEAKKIFNLNLNKFKILVHPKSYVHAIVKFNNGLTKILIHDTDMKIPIFNSIYDKDNKKIKTKKINVNSLNNLDFTNINLIRFPSVKLLNLIPNKDSLFETVLVSANDELVNLFLKNKIKFLDISKLLNKIVKLKIFTKYKHVFSKNFSQIEKLSQEVRLKTRSLSVL